MRSEAQKRADKAHKKKLRRVPLDLNIEDPADRARLEHVQKQENINAYLKGLIDRDIEIEKFSKDCEKML